MLGDPGWVLLGQVEVWGCRGDLRGGLGTKLGGWVGWGEAREKPLPTIAAVVAPKWRPGGN